MGEKQYKEWKVMEMEATLDRMIREGLTDKRYLNKES